VRVICDESGAKGKATNEESFPGETGLFVGILVPDAHVAAFEAEMQRLITKYQPRLPSSTSGSSSKVHVTDLLKTDRQELRSDLWEVMRSLGIRWVFEAIYVQGFHAAHQRTVHSLTEATRARTSTVSVSRNIVIPSLHVALFEGVFATAAAAALDEAGTGGIALEVIVHHVDASLEDAFRKAATELLEPLGGISGVSGFDKSTSEVVRGTVAVTVSGLDQPDVESSTFTLVVVPSGAPLALAADVLAHSLDEHLRNSPIAQRGAPLHTTRMIVGHPVAGLVLALDSAVPRPPDILFPHPRWPAASQPDDSAV
jgi:hypothetical protein